MSVIPKMSFEKMEAYASHMSAMPAYMLVSHKNEDGNYVSRSISIDDLAIQLKNSIPDIRSAAYCASSDFALSSHDHDIYTSVDFYPASFDSETDVAPILSIYDMTHEKKMSTISIAKIASNADEGLINIISTYLPKLGTIEFLGAKDLGIYSKYFSTTCISATGWVPANGATYDLTSFMLSNDLKNVFQHTDTTFTVPSLVEFPKIYCASSRSTNSYSTIKGQTQLSSHAHTMSIAPNSTASITSKSIDTHGESVSRMLNGMIKGAGSNSTCTFTKKGDNLNVKITGCNAIHNGKDTSKNQNKTQIKTFPLYLKDVKHIKDMWVNNIALVQQEGSSSDISYPSHIALPAVIYVGPSKNADLVASYVKNE